MDNDFPCKYNVYSNTVSANDSNFGEHCYNKVKGPWWQSGNTLASHLWGQGSIPARAHMGKLVVACRWSAVYSTEP